MNKINPALQEQLATIVSSMGYELVGCEALPQGRHMVLRVYIDKENGVTVDDCSQVSRQASAMLDVADPFQSRYTLEVSSPGINRPLFELAHYERYIGRQVKIKLYAPINNRRHYNGTLTKVVGEQIHLLPEGAEQEVVLPFSAIDKGNLIYSA
ncbi:MAG: ribosome maturation factor RimP [Gammaproteobacteria bacterium]